LGRERCFFSKKKERRPKGLKKALKDTLKREHGFISAGKEETITVEGRKSGGLKKLL